MKIVCMFGRKCGVYTENTFKIQGITWNIDYLYFDVAWLWSLGASVNINVIINFVWSQNILAQTLVVSARKLSLNYKQIFQQGKWTKTCIQIPT